MSARAIVTAHMKGREKLARLRAKRFDLHLPMKYRFVGESGWHTGTTENISRSGMLFPRGDDGCTQRPTGNPPRTSGRNCRIVHCGSHLPW